MPQEGLVITFVFVVLVDFLWRREGVARPKPEKKVKRIVRQTVRFAYRVPSDDSYPDSASGPICFL